MTRSHRIPNQLRFVAFLALWSHLKARITPTITEPVLCDLILCGQRCAISA